MISSSQIKLIHSLRQKKYRDHYNLYVMEGEKMVGELTGGKAGAGHQIHILFATGDWIEQHKTRLSTSGVRVIEAGVYEMKKVSNLLTPPPVIALVTMPQPVFDVNEILHHPVLAFESIRDPGNLGTILRTADWFGIDYVICTPDSADVYNPKVVQSTMGAITRVRIIYREIEQILDQPSMQQKTVYGTFLDGESIYETNLIANPLILFGNESHGLSNRYNPYIHKKISIPSFSVNGAGPESLNVATSVAIVCSELRR